MSVRNDSVRAKELLTYIYNRERKSSLATYQKQLRRARRDPTFPEFKETATELAQTLEKRQRLKYRVQKTTCFPDLFSNGHALQPRFNNFLAKLAQKCAGHWAGFGEARAATWC